MLDAPYDPSRPFHRYAVRRGPDRWYSRHAMRKGKIRPIFAGFADRHVFNNLISAEQVARECHARLIDVDMLDADPSQPFHRYAVCRGYERNRWYARHEMRKGKIRPIFADFAYRHVFNNRVSAEAGRQGMSCPALIDVDLE